MTQSAIAHRIRQTRETRRLTQAELAERAGLPPATVSHFETGVRVPGTSTLRKLADALEVSLDYLLGRVDEPDGVGPVHQVLHRDLRDLSTESLEIVQGIIKDLKKRDQKKRSEDS